MAEITITAENFEKEVLQAKEPVLVDFWASWCGPCKMLSPIISELAEEYDGRVKIGKVNVDEQPQLAAQYRVSGIPTVILFKGGQAVDLAVGYRPKAQLEAMLKL